MQESTIPTLPADNDSLWGDSDWAVDAPRNEALRQAQEDTWTKTVKTVDGRAHFSDREASHLHADKLRRTVADYHKITALVAGLIQKGGGCLLTQLGAELVEHIVEILFPGQGSIVLSLFEQLQQPPINRAESHFRLCVRKRPLLQFELAAGEYNVVDAHPARTSLCCHDGKLARSGRRMTMTHRFYSCDRVWAPADSNASVFHSEVQPLLDWSLAAPANASTLLCYGQTGTGKTYTLMGMLEHLAQDLSSRRFGVEVLFFEVHGKKCYDLLADRALVHLRSDQEGRVHVRGAKRVRLLPPAAPEEEGVEGAGGKGKGSASPRTDGAARLMEVLRGALALRMTEATERNPISSRSHAVCELRLLRWRKEGEEEDRAEGKGEEAEEGQEAQAEADANPAAKPRVVIERASPEWIAKQEAEEAAAFAAAVSEWRAEKANGGGQAKILEAGGDFGPVEGKTELAVQGMQQALKPPPSPCRGKLHPSKAISLADADSTVDNSTVDTSVGGMPSTKVLIDMSGAEREAMWKRLEKAPVKNELLPSSPVKTLGTLRLVDLAGSERNYETTRMTPAQVAAPSSSPLPSPPPPPPSPPSLLPPLPSHPLALFSHPSSLQPLVSVPVSLFFVSPYLFQHKESAVILKGLLALKNCFRAYHVELTRQQKQQKQKQRKQQEAAKGQEAAKVQATKVQAAKVQEAESAGEAAKNVVPDADKAAAQGAVESGTVPQNETSPVNRLSSYKQPSGAAKLARDAQGSYSRKQGSAKGGAARVRIPFRSDRLTQVLRDCFIDYGQHRTVVITTVSPTPTDLQHSVNSLDHAILMVPELTNCCTSTAVDVPIVSMGPTALSEVPVNEWSAQQVKDWVASVQGGRFAKLALPADLDGMGLLKLSSARMSALFEGAMRDARSSQEGASWTVGSATEQGGNSGGGSSSGDVQDDAPVADVDIGRVLYNALRRQQWKLMRQQKQQQQQADAGAEQRRLLNMI
jgi:hypothetical protein